MGVWNLRGISKKNLEPEEVEAIFQELDVLCEQIWVQLTAIGLADTILLGMVSNMAAKLFYKKGDMDWCIKAQGCLSSQPTDFKFNQRREELVSSASNILKQVEPLWSCYKILTNSQINTKERNKAVATLIDINTKLNIDSCITKLRYFQRLRTFVNLYLVKRNLIVESFARLISKHTWDLEGNAEDNFQNGFLGILDAVNSYITGSYTWLGYCNSWIKWGAVGNNMRPLVSSEDVEQTNLLDEYPSPEPETNLLEDLAQGLTEEQLRVLAVEYGTWNLLTTRCPSEEEIVVNTLKNLMAGG